MSQILGIKFREHGQVYYFESGPFVVKLNDHVLVKTEQGMGMGMVVSIHETVPAEFRGEELKKIYRLASEEDVASQRENEKLAAEAFQVCRRCIVERKLDMKLVDVETFFDRSKMIFYFTAPGRIDFRELVKDLVRAYRTRIELRQIGVRHETQMIGAVGNCGQVCCCRRFMRKFAPVTIKMAKEQSLFLNPTKISGICGRLLCCLSFEQSNYEEFHRRCPKIGKKFTTSLGAVRVVRANLFRESLTIQTEAGEEREVDLEEWSRIAGREYEKLPGQPLPASAGLPAAPEGGPAPAAGPERAPDLTRLALPEGARPPAEAAPTLLPEGAEPAREHKGDRERRDGRRGEHHPHGAGPKGRPPQRQSGGQGSGQGQGKDGSERSRQPRRDDDSAARDAEARPDRSGKRGQGERRPDQPRPDQPRTHQPQERAEPKDREAQPAQPDRPADRPDRAGQAAQPDPAGRPDRSRRRRKRKPRPRDNG